MSTRGAIGFIVNGEEKISYNHFDSYPSGLGSDILQWLGAADMHVVRELAATLRTVDEDTPPTPADVERLLRFADPRVATGSLTDWYVLLRGTQGDPALMLEAGIIEDAHNFPLDSLFCAWAYVVDFDAGVFEVYRGFQTEPHTEGRFAGRIFQPSHRRDTYYPVRLVATWPLTALPAVSELTALESSDEDDD